MLEVTVKLLGPPGTYKTTTAKGILRELLGLPLRQNFDLEVKVAQDGEQEPEVELRASRQEGIVLIAWNKENL